VALRCLALCTAALLLAACASQISQPPPPLPDSVPVSIAVEEEPVRQVVGPTLAQVSFAFEPYTGGPRNITDKLSKKVVNVAQIEGLILKRQRGAVTTYKLLGHLTAVGDDAGTTVIYRYDILDAAGRHLHRIHGQEISNSARGDPWSGVSDETLRNIAARTVNAVKTWVLSRSG
jgi:hypothetical protein